MQTHVALWRRLDCEGLESLHLHASPHGLELTGTAIFVHEAQPCRLSYLIHCDENWQSRSAHVHGWIGARPVEQTVGRGPSGRWSHNGRDLPEFDGILDVDLNFSPLTNLLPIRRRHLAIGQSEKVTAAWLRFPSFKLEPLEQVYRRDGENAYHYSSAGGRFQADITTDEFGLVYDYPPAWQRMRF